MPGSTVQEMTTVSAAKSPSNMSLPTARDPGACEDPATIRACKQIVSQRPMCILSTLDSVADRAIATLLIQGLEASGLRLARLWQQQVRAWAGDREAKVCAIKGEVEVCEAGLELHSVHIQEAAMQKEVTAPQKYVE